MAMRVKDLALKSKGNATTNDVILVVNKKTGQNSQFALTDVFPKLQNGNSVGASVLGSVLGITPTTMYVGGGYASSVTGSENNTLIFKGFRLNSSTSPLKLKEETDSGDVLKGNIVLDWDASAYELSNFANTTTGFLSTVALATNVSGILPVSNGGTGINAFADKAVVLTQTSGTDLLKSVTMVRNGELLMGGVSGPVAGLIAEGTNVTVTNSDGGISIAASLTTLAATLNTSNNKIQMGSGWLTNDGDSEGLLLNGTSKLFVGSSTPTAYHADDLNVNSSITLGDVNGTTAQYLRMRGCASGSTPVMNILGSSTVVAGNAGGDVLVQAGTGSGSGAGGGLTLKGGLDGGSGTDGSISLYTGDVKAVSIDANQDTTFTGNVMITAATDGLVHTGSGSVTQATNHSTGVTLNATSGGIRLAAVALNAAAEADFTVTNSTIQTDSLIMLTVQCPVAGTAVDNATMVAQISRVTTGSFNIRLTNPGAAATSANAYKIFFLIINNSV